MNKLIKALLFLSISFFTFQQSFSDLGPYGEYEFEEMKYCTNLARLNHTLPQMCQEFGWNTSVKTPCRAVFVHSYLYTNNHVLPYTSFCNDKPGQITICQANPNRCDTGHRLLFPVDP